MTKHGLSRTICKFNLFLCNFVASWGSNYDNGEMFEFKLYLNGLKPKVYRFGIRYKFCISRSGVIFLSVDTNRNNRSYRFPTDRKKGFLLKNLRHMAT